MVIISTNTAPTPEYLKAAKVLWEYLKLDLPISHCDCIITMGSHDLRVGEYAAKLMLDGWGSVLVCSGGFGRLTVDLWKTSEAKQFSEIAIQAGVARDRILIENRSTNTGENIRFSRNLLKQKGVATQKILLVHKPYMERRALATAQKLWPQVEYSITSPPISFEDYPNDDISLDQLIHTMVGDFQRILLYPEKGFQVVQDVSKESMDAYNLLVKAGFTDQIIQECG